EREHGRRAAVRRRDRDRSAGPPDEVRGVRADDEQRARAHSARLPASPTPRIATHRLSTLVSTALRLYQRAVTGGRESPKGGRTVGAGRESAYTTLALQTREAEGAALSLAKPFTDRQEVTYESSQIGTPRVTGDRADRYGALRGKSPGPFGASLRNAQHEPERVHAPQ